jgi:hypothetical protein
MSTETLASSFMTQREAMLSAVDKRMIQEKVNAEEAKPPAPPRSALVKVGFTLHRWAASHDG